MVAKESPLEGAYAVLVVAFVADAHERLAQVAGRRAVRPGPQADASFRQAAPVEQLAGILLARGCDVTVRHHVLRRDRVAPQYAEAQLAYCGHLRRRVWPVAPFMAGIDDLDTDRGIVQRAPAAPVGHAGVEGAALLGHQAEDGAVLVHHVMRGHARFRVAQPGHRFGAGFHAGVVQHQHVDGAGALVLVGARQVGDEKFAHRPRSRFTRSQAALMLATFSVARAMNSGGTPRAASPSGWLSRISCFQAARTVSSVAERATPSTP